MEDPRRQLATSAVLALVLLRLVIGWHFFYEGLSKLEYDRTTGSYRIGFSAEPFFAQAKGPLAGLYHAQVSHLHDWPRLLAVPRENRPLTDEQSAEQATWDAEYQARVAEAQKSNKPAPVEFPPYEPYYDWAQKIVDDWKAVLAEVTAIPELSEEQARKAADAFELRRQQLADYFAEEASAMTDYQHELARLERWMASPEADGVPFQRERIAAKQAETTATVRAWVNQVAEFEQNYLVDLRHVLSAEQRAESNLESEMDDALATAHSLRIDWINLTATVLTLGVGICLLTGLFTRVASVVGALFLLTVIASQPPWIPDAQSTIYQTIELVALLVLAATAAGRWLGLDYVTYVLFHKKKEHEV